MDFKWTTGDDGLVQVMVPKFTGKVGKKFVKTLRRDNIFSAHFDRLGSSVWKQCDGTVTVKQILDVVTIEFPNEKDIDQRLFLFLQQLRALHYITFY